MPLSLTKHTRDQPTPLTLNTAPTNVGELHFSVTDVRFGVVTNGVLYRFYADLEKKHVMDSSPFLVVDMTDLRSEDIEELKKFRKWY